MTCLIFDLQRCALHDGPGIRTTVFLKGCPLACVWCHNPESISPQPELSFLAECCAVCGACQAACPSRVHTINDQHHLNRDLCLSCGACVRVCPRQALRVIGEEMEVSQILAVVARDNAYYARSGGGITLSGGEPMLQFEFTLALLQGAHARGLHTCLDTCGLAPQGRYAEVLPLVDLFLFDYKATDPAQHREFTGVSNEAILANLDFLSSQGAAIHLRCPLVPGVNDSSDHLAGIAALSARYPRLSGVEIMPFHSLGRDKGKMVGREAKLSGLETTSAETKARWLAALHELGCGEATLGQ